MYTSIEMCVHSFSILAEEKRGTRSRLSSNAVKCILEHHIACIYMYMYIYIVHVLLRYMYMYMYMYVCVLYICYACNFVHNQKPLSSNNPFTICLSL